MKKGNPAAGYVLLALLVVLLGLVITTVARDLRGAGDTARLAEPAAEQDEDGGDTPAQPATGQNQARVWEGTM